MEKFLSWGEIPIDTGRLIKSLRIRRLKPNASRKYWQIRISIGGTDESADSTTKWAGIYSIFSHLGRDKQAVAGTRREVDYAGAVEEGFPLLWYPGERMRRKFTDLFDEAIDYAIERWRTRKS